MVKPVGVNSALLWPLGPVGRSLPRAISSVKLHDGQEEWAVATTIVTAPGNGKSLREGMEA